MKRRPSTWLAVALVVAFALQWFPYTGIYLMFFGAMIWTGWIFLALLVAMTIEALSGRLPRAAILLPIAVVLGYYGVLAGQRLQINALVAETAAQNAQALSPETVVGRDPLFRLSGALYNDRVAVSALMSKYALDTVYIRRFGGGFDETMDHLTVAPTCVPPAVAVPVKDYGYPPVSLCITETIPLDYAGKVVVASDSERTAFWGSELTTLLYDLSIDDQVRGNAKALQAELWPYLPQPLIGCGLVSGGPDAGWRCAAAPYPPERLEWPPQLHAEAGYFGETDLSPVAEKLGLPLR